MINIWYNGLCFLKPNMLSARKLSQKKTFFQPPSTICVWRVYENWCLGGSFPFRKAYFQGLWFMLVSERAYSNVLQYPKLTWTLNKPFHLSNRWLSFFSHSLQDGRGFTFSHHIQLFQKQIHKFKSITHLIIALIPFYQYCRNYFNPWRFFWSDLLFFRWKREVVIPCCHSPRLWSDVPGVCWGTEKSVNESLNTKRIYDISDLETPLQPTLSWACNKITNPTFGNETDYYTTPQQFTTGTQNDQRKFRSQSLL